MTSMFSGWPRHSIFSDSRMPCGAGSLLEPLLDQLLVLRRHRGLAKVQAHCCSSPLNSIRLVTPQAVARQGALLLAGLQRLTEARTRLLRQGAVLGPEELDRTEVPLVGLHPAQQHIPLDGAEAGESSQHPCNVGFKVGPAYPAAAGTQ